MDIKGKKAIVFGGTSGIGLATCKELQARGANVVAVSRDPNKAGTSIDGIRLVAVDARDSDAVSAFFESEEKIDILISSATGGSRALARFWKWILMGLKDHLINYGVTAILCGMARQSLAMMAVLFLSAAPRPAR